VEDLKFLDEGIEVYQDVIINGELVRRGVRECAGRYTAIQGILNMYKRPFTVFDIGAHLGYFGLSIVHDYPEAVVVMADYDPRLRQIVELSDPDRTVVLEKNFSPEDLQQMSECEQFDIVLLLNVLHHWENWPDVLSAARHMADFVIVETPDPADKGACNNHLVPDIFAAMHGQMTLMRPPSHTSDVPRHMFVVAGTPPMIRKSFLDPAIPAGLHYQMCSLFTDKSIWKGGEWKKWMPGLNLWTYHKMGGVYPSRERIVDMLKVYPLPVERHGDVRPWNFILGDGLTLIDGRDEKANFEDEEGRQYTIDCLKEEPWVTT